MPSVLIGVGSNLGNRQSILDKAVETLRDRLNVTAVSKWFTYPAVGGPGEQEDFLNGAVAAETDLPATELQQLLHEIEREAGRERITRWSSRTLDCDLLLYGQEQIETPTLQVPHPRMMTRRFVLEPANDIACDLLHPYSGWSIGRLYQHLQTAPPYFSVLGHDLKKVDSIANEIAEATDFELFHLPTRNKRESDTSSDLANALEWVARGKETLPSYADCSGTSTQRNEEQGWISTFWIWEPWLRNAELPVPETMPQIVEPKLLVVLDSPQNEFRHWLSKLDARLRVPTLFLSEDPQHAVQDAVGAVLSMTM